MEHIRGFTRKPLDAAIGQVPAPCIALVAIIQTHKNTIKELFVASNLRYDQPLELYMRILYAKNNHLLNSSLQQAA